MPISITEQSRSTLERLIRTEFEKIDWDMEYIYNRAGELINTCKELGMYHLAEQLENDKAA